MTGLIDTHVHLDLLGTAEDAAVLAEAARGAGVAGFLVPGVESRHWPRLLAVVRGIAGARAAPGLHPGAATTWSPRSRERLEALLADPVVVAIGEIGLDKTPGMPAMDAQERAFREQLEMAVAAGRPVSIHCRRATGRLLELLHQAEVARVGGIWHSFSGSLETARTLHRLGMAVGIGGAVTYPNARRLREVVRGLPADGFVLETDAPDLSPHPHRGRPNRPEWLGLIAEKVAEVRGWTLEETARVTSRTACRVLPAAGWLENERQAPPEE
jgi:TatD DNase family protein